MCVSSGIARLTPKLLAVSPLGSENVAISLPVSVSKTWTPVLDPWLPFAAPLAGALVGLASGLYPAGRAASLQPVDALRSGT